MRKVLYSYVNLKKHMYCRLALSVLIICLILVRPGVFLQRTVDQIIRLRQGRLKFFIVLILLALEIIGL